jgi:PqqD family protein of HPr-rel-A system
VDERPTEGSEPLPPVADAGSDEDAPIAVTPGYVPRRAPDVVELDLEDGLILFNRDSSLVHHLNPSGRIVWFLADGSATVDRLAREIAEEYGLEPASVRAQVAGLVAELDAVGLVEDVGEAGAAERG